MIRFDSKTGLPLIPNLLPGHVSFAKDPDSWCNFRRVSVQVFLAKVERHGYNSCFLFAALRRRFVVKSALDFLRNQNPHHPSFLYNFVREKWRRHPHTTLTHVNTKKNTQIDDPISPLDENTFAIFAIFEKDKSSPLDVPVPP